MYNTDFLALFHMFYALSVCVRACARTSVLLLVEQLHVSMNPIDGSRYLEVKGHKEIFENASEKSRGVRNVMISDLCFCSCTNMVVNSGNFQI